MNVPDLLQGLLGVSDDMRGFEGRLRRLAAEDATVLFVGPPGIGLGRLARALHQLSPRAAGPWVAVSAAGEPDVVLAETSAALLRAPGGSLLLDGVDRMALGAQSRMAGLLEDRADGVRVLGATHADLAQAVEEGHFREPLYRRLAGQVAAVPALAERSERDRAHVLDAVISVLQAELPDAPPGVSPGAREALLARSWPGNLREMRNVVEGAMIRARGAPLLAVAHLPADVGRGPGRTLKGLERQHVAAALRAHRGNRTRAARELGISRVTLLKKIRDYRIE